MLLGNVSPKYTPESPMGQLAQQLVFFNELNIDEVSTYMVDKGYQFDSLDELYDVVLDYLGEEPSEKRIQEMTSLHYFSDIVADIKEDVSAQALINLQEPVSDETKKPKQYIGGVEVNLKNIGIAVLVLIVVLKIIK